MTAASITNGGFELQGINGQRINKIFKSTHKQNTFKSM